MSRDDGPSIGHAVLVELEFVDEKFRRVLVVDEVEAWFDWSRRWPRAGTKMWAAPCRGRPRGNDCEKERTALAENTV